MTRPYWMFDHELLNVGNPTTYRERGTGRTTIAMHYAKPKAVYIWCNDNLEYPKRLALNIGRRDLKIVGPNWLEEGWIGMEYPEIVVDHAAHLTERKIALLEGAATRCRP